MALTEKKWVKAAEKIKRALDQGGWGHAIWCNYQSPGLKNCNCGLANILHLLKEEGKNVSKDAPEAYRQAAKDAHEEEGQIEFDCSARCSEVFIDGDEFETDEDTGRLKGMWISCWAWVDAEEES